MGVKTTLPSYELGFYALAVTCAVLYSGSGIFEASRGNVPPVVGVSHCWQHRHGFNFCA